jgi:hypothetical protein
MINYSLILSHSIFRYFSTALYEFSPKNLLVSCLVQTSVLELLCDKLCGDTSIQDRIPNQIKREMNFLVPVTLIASLLTYTNTQLTISRTHLNICRAFIKSSLAPSESIKFNGGVFPLLTLSPPSTEYPANLP